MAIVTKTIHPLPFENLDPNRFEDLVRQLAYDFRDWISLEATGRSGSDSGYDIRGLERIGSHVDRPAPLDTDGIEDEDELTDPNEDRLWLVQCKREKEIGPSKLGRYIDAISSEEKKRIYGLIVVASCDISKKARDVFLAKCREAGISECYIWSRAELEDMLFQPKNDGLLFAYFGISLTLRRRSVINNLRSKLSIKRKLIRTFGNGKYISRSALFLNPEDTDYPYSTDGQDYRDLSWKVRRLTEYHPLGIWFEAKRYAAFLDEDRIHWDMADVFNEDTEIWQNPWASEEEEKEHSRLRMEINEIVRQFPQQCRAFIVVEGLVKFEDILEVDKDGDSIFHDPIIYVNCNKDGIPCISTHAVLRSESVYGERRDSEPLKEIVPSAKIHLPDIVTNRIEKFPSQYRKT